MNRDEDCYGMKCYENGYGICVMNGGPWDGGEMRLPVLLKRFIGRADWTPVGWKFVYRRTPLHDDRGRIIWDFAGTIRPES
jgi:hypothetical protein